MFDSAHVFGLMDLDTLFYIFYYQSGSYQQFIAARELKQRGWSFNTRYTAYTSQHSIGKGQHMIVDNKYEQGTYIFFDRNQSWQMRMREFQV